MHHAVTTPAHTSLVAILEASPYGTQAPPPFSSIPSPSAVVAQAAGIRLLGGDVPVVTAPRRGKAIAVAGLDLVTRVPGTALVAVPL